MHDAMRTPSDQLYDSLTTPKVPRSQTAALMGYYAAADQNATEKAQTRGVRVACCEGCSHCCHQRVCLLAHEVFAIVDHVESHFSVEEKTVTVARLKDYTEAVGAITTEERDRRNISCPFLQENRCTVHPARPMNCRSFHSLDRGRCERRQQHPEVAEFRFLPTSTFLSELWEQMTKELDFAFAGNHYDQRTYELGTACLAAFSNPVYRRRWAQKKAALFKV